MLHAYLCFCSCHFYVDLRNPELIWEWMDVGVLDWEASKKLFLVQKCDANGRVLDARGKTVINGARDEQHPGQVTDRNKYDANERVLDAKSKTVINGARDEQHPGQVMIGTDVNYEIA